jgi:hypothetical protein
MDLATFFAQHPFLSAFFFGVVAAMRLDYQAFRKSQQGLTEEQVLAGLATYKWKVAAIRWGWGGLTTWWTALSGDAALRNLPGLF